MMEKEQQIEEMARDIPQRIVAYDGDPDGQYLYVEQRLEIARTLYNAGYRKQSENTIEVVRCKDCVHCRWEQEPCHGKTIYKCFVLNAEVFKDFYCYHGKQKMKGGAE